MTFIPIPPPFPRRSLLALAALFGMLAAPALAAVAPGQAVSLVTSTGNQLVALINGGADTATRRQALQAIVDSNVDVDGVAKFCLGRFWRAATPQQQQDYLAVFHATLMRNLTANLGDYQGVTFSVGQVMPRDDGSVSVETVLTRPNNQPNNVDWVVSDKTGAPKITDLVVEGTSMRLTTRSEYSSYMLNNGNDLDALIAALKAKASS
jgi:phospholipid transport system substrate-binding protein